MNPRFSRIRDRTVLVLLGLFVLACRPAAALDEAGRCFHDKMRASRTVAASYLACGLRHGDGDPRRDRCERRLETRISRMVALANSRADEAGFRCPAGADAMGLSGTSNWPFRLVRELSTQGSQACVPPPASAARRFTSAYSRCVEDVWLSERGDVEACAAEARARFDKAWQGVLGAARCPDEEVARVIGRMEEEIDETASRLEVRCGDGVVGGFEECDDGATANGDGCSTDCRREECRRAGEEVRCVVCPAGSVPTDGVDGCRCPDGFDGEPGACVDIDECATGENPCGEDGVCINLAGTWSCAIECTAEAFHRAIADCGAPSGAITFNCTDTVIAIPAGIVGRPRDVHCDGLTIDGAGRGITFELDPLCWRTPIDASQCPGGLEEDGTCHCPDFDSGDAFVALRGNGNVVRDLTVRGFFDGIPVRGRGNVVENMHFDRLCDDAFGSISGGVGNVFRDSDVRRGCDKCSENGGLLEDTDPDPRLREHYHSILSNIEFDGCLTPVRVASSGRILMDGVYAHSSDPEFPCDGPRFSSSSAEARVMLEMKNSTVVGCRRGVRLGRGVEAVLADDFIANCSLRGVRASNSAQVSIEGSTIIGSGGSGSSENGFGGVAAVSGGSVDLGGGSLEIDGRVVRSAGNNTLCHNVGPSGLPRDVESEGPTAIPAMANWWCSMDEPGESVLGLAEVSPALSRAPLPRHP